MTYVKTAFSVGAYSKSLVVDVPIGKEFFVIYNDKSFKSVSVSSNGKTAISGGADNKTIVDDVSTGMIITTFKYESCVKFVAVWEIGSQQDEKKRNRVEKILRSGENVVFADPEILVASNCKIAQ